jgi:hypothetical protein
MAAAVVRGAPPQQRRQVPSEESCQGYLPKVHLAIQHHMIVL